MCVYTGPIPTVDDLPPAVVDDLLPLIPPDAPDHGRRWTEKGLSPHAFEDIGNDGRET